MIIIRKTFHSINNELYEEQKIDSKLNDNQIKSKDQLTMSQQIKQYKMNDKKNLNEWINKWIKNNNKTEKVPGFRETKPSKTYKLKKWYQIK